MATSPDEHLAHAVGRCVRLLRLHAQEPTPDPNDLDALASHDGHLEAGLGHARATIEFLVGRRGNQHYRNPRHIGPADFGLSPSWLPSPQLTARLQRWLDDIDAHLAHLSKERMVAKPVWRPAALVMDIADGIDAVINSMSTGSVRLARVSGEARSVANELGGVGQPTIPTRLSRPATTTTPDPVIHIQRGHR